MTCQMFSFISNLFIELILNYYDFGKLRMGSFFTIVNNYKILEKKILKINLLQQDLGVRLFVSGDGR